MKKYKLLILIVSLLVVALIIAIIIWTRQKYTDRQAEELTETVEKITEAENFFFNDQELLIYKNSCIYELENKSEKEVYCFKNKPENIIASPDHQNFIAPFCGDEIGSLCQYSIINRTTKKITSLDQKAISPIFISNNEIAYNFYDEEEEISRLYIFNLNNNREEKVLDFGDNYEKTLYPVNDKLLIAVDFSYDVGELYSEIIDIENETKTEYLKGDSLYYQVNPRGDILAVSEIKNKVYLVNLAYPLENNVQNINIKASRKEIIWENKGNGFLFIKDDDIYRYDIGGRSQKKILAQIGVLSDFILEKNFALDVNDEYLYFLKSGYLEKIKIK